ncbi:bidirectional sugar transporter SWEET5-like [Triticum urartu]|uniref:bidirectional sugar transporter SWEET5-like n=1 Tax=Triticum urartu TaxID=4572 RepID=UPI0020444AF8|nr:bidirectional sugar transporter SWEET5-like [Triticum urartu]
MVDAHAAKQGIGILGDVAVGILVFLPICMVFRHIKEAQDVGQRTVLPYVSTWMNAASFVFYGYNRSDRPVATINGIAFLVEAIYCAVYIYYAQGWRRQVAVAMAVVQGAFLALLVSLQLTVFSHGRNAEKRDQVFGGLGLGTAVLMYLSTMDQTVRAYRTHDVDGLEMSFTYLFNALIWLVYAALPTFDAFVLSASIVGVLATGYQAFLWVRYRNAPILEANAGIEMPGGGVNPLPPVIPPADDPLLEANAGIEMPGGGVNPLPPVIPPADDPLLQPNAGIAVAAGVVISPVIPPANDGIAVAAGVVIPPANDGIAVAAGVVIPPVIAPADDPLLQGIAENAMAAGGVIPPAIPPAEGQLPQANGAAAAAAAIDQADGAAAAAAIDQAEGAAAAVIDQAEGAAVAAAINQAEGSPA